MKLHPLALPLLAAAALPAVALAAAPPTPGLPMSGIPGGKAITCRAFLDLKEATATNVLYFINGYAAGIQDQVSAGTPNSTGTGNSTAPAKADDLSNLTGVTMDEVKTLCRAKPEASVLSANRAAASKAPPMGGKRDRQRTGGRCHNGRYGVRDGQQPRDQRGRQHRGDLRRERIGHHQHDRGRGGAGRRNRQQRHLGHAQHGNSADARDRHGHDQSDDGIIHCDAGRRRQRDWRHGGRRSSALRRGRRPAERPMQGEIAGSALSPQPA